MPRAARKTKYDEWEATFEEQRVEMASLGVEERFKPMPPRSKLTKMRPEAQTMLVKNALRDNDHQIERAKDLASAPAPEPKRKVRASRPGSPIPFASVPLLCGRTSFTQTG